MDDTYLFLKSLHIVGAVIFLGNIIVSGFWKFMADRTRNPTIIAFAQRQITVTDFLFTAGGALLLFGAGVADAVLYQMDMHHTKWLSHGGALFAITGVIWIGILVPLQVKQARIAKTFSDEGSIPEHYWKLVKLWNLFGMIATLLPLAAIYWMVFKPV